MPGGDKMIKVIGFVIIGFIFLYIKSDIELKKSTKEHRERMAREKLAKKEDLKRSEMTQLKDAIKLADDSYVAQKEKTGEKIKEIEYSPEYAMQIKGEKVYLLESVSRNVNVKNLYIQDKEVDYKGEVIKWKDIDGDGYIYYDESFLAITENRILTLGAVERGFTYDLRNLEYIEKGIMVNTQTISGNVISDYYPGVVLAFSNKVNGKIIRHIVFGENAHKVAAFLEDFLVN